MVAYPEVVIVFVLTFIPSVLVSSQMPPIAPERLQFPEVVIVLLKTNPVDESAIFIPDASWPDVVIVFDVMFASVPDSPNKIPLVSSPEPDVVMLLKFILVLTEVSPILIPEEFSPEVIMMLRVNSASLFSSTKKIPRDSVPYVVIVFDMMFAFVELDSRCIP